MNTAKSGAESGPRTKVLLVDDEPGFTRLLRLCLAHVGAYDVVEINNPLEVLAVLEKQEFSVIILDIIMPEMLGSELLSRIRERGISTPAFFLSATIGKDEAPVLVEGSDKIYFLAKPVTHYDVANAITKITTAPETIPRLGQLPEEKKVEIETQGLRKEAVDDASAAFLHKLNSLFNTLGLMVANEGRLIKQYASNQKDLIQANAELAVAVEATSYVIQRFRNTFGRHPGTIKQIDIRQVLTDVCQHLEKVFSIPLSLQLGKALCWVKGDYELLWHLFENLIRNALEAVQTVSNGFVIVSLQSVASGAHIRVRDNGKGIAPEALRHVYDLNYSTKSGGLGVGLYLVYSAVRFHGGSIKCRSAAGFGTEFSVAIPLLKEQKE